MTLRRRQALCTALLLLDEEEEIARNNRASWINWVKPWLERQDELGVYNNLFQGLYEINSLKEYIRMDRMYFNYLVERLYPYLLKEDTVMRERVSNPLSRFACYDTSQVGKHFVIWNTSSELADDQ